ncbi:MFS transporter [Solihabitans fulvus]|uniref:MFS transporter n=2 Tax=Solihabitans fulvus TaxID=1892852 RepID=A0A5B2WUU1_9PSEU|nr:MFS transporter [Solihabitans fulvus]
MLGANISEVAIPIIASIMLSASLFQMGLLGAVAYLPYLFMSLFAGAWLDRKPKRPFLIVADVTRGVLLLLIPFAWWQHMLTIPLLLVITVLVGFCSVVSDIAGSSILPSLVERTELVDANSKLELSSSVSNIGGNAIGGAIVQALTAPFAMMFNAVLYVVSGLFTALIKKKEPTPEATDEERSIWRDIAEGAAFVVNNVTIRTLTLATLVANFFAMALEPVFLVYITRTLHLAPFYIGLVLSSSGLGAFVGALIAGPLSRRIPLGKLLVLTSIVVGLASLLTPLATFMPTLIAVILLVAMHIIDAAAIIVCNINLRSYRTSITPDNMQGRMTASIRTVVMGMSPLGAIFGGLLGGWVGIQFALIITALGILSAAGVIGFSRIRKVVRPAESPEPDGPSEDDSDGSTESTGSTESNEVTA